MARSPGGRPPRRRAQRPAGIVDVAVLLALLAVAVAVAWRVTAWVVG